MADWGNAVGNVAPAGMVEAERPGRAAARRGLRYVLITPARNESDFIRLTLESVAAQTHPPVQWVIVSDGSTDGTDDIVREYCHRFVWITLLRLPEDRPRSFAAKVACFNAGLSAVHESDIDVVGNLDADISFGPDYFEFLLARFAENPRLGVAGTPFVEGGRHYDYRFASIEHVSGACQLFRRACFEEIGGYVPLPCGGIDWTAVTTARMKGWQTRTFVNRTCIHHRPIGTASLKGTLRPLFRHGEKDHALGWHPVWELFRGVHRMAQRPYLVGGVALLAGYSWALVTAHEHAVSAELVQFNRSEQMARLKAIALGRRGPR